MSQQIVISNCSVCGRELKDPIPEFGDGFFLLNDGRKICEYCYMGSYVDGYIYDRDGNLNRDPDDMDFFEKLWNKIIRLINRKEETK